MNRTALIVWLGIGACAWSVAIMHIVLARRWRYPIMPPAFSLVMAGAYLSGAGAVMYRAGSLAEGLLPVVVLAVAASLHGWLWWAWRGLAR